MRIYTVHAGPAPSSPVSLVREGFSLFAAVAPALWLLLHRLWLAFVLYAAGVVLLGVLLPLSLLPWVTVGVNLLLGWQARDIERWTLARRGRALVAVVAAADEEAAYARLADTRPELVPGLAA